MIFVKAEEEFRIEAANSVRGINIDKIISTLEKNSEVISSFNAIIEYSCVHVTEEVEDNLLANMLKLFLKVRSFSLSRDIVEKHRQNMKLKRIKSGLRKSLKKNNTDTQSQ